MMMKFLLWFIFNFFFFLAQPINLCPVDLHKLQQLCGFDIVDRYQKVLSFSFYFLYLWEDTTSGAKCRVDHRKELKSWRFER